MANHTTVYFAIDNLAKMFSTDGTIRTSVMPGGVEIVLFDLINELITAYSYNVCFLTYDLSDERVSNKISIRNISNRNRTLFAKVLEKIGLKKRQIFRLDENAVLYIAQAEGPQLIDAAKRAKIPVIFRINGDSIVDITLCPDSCYPMVRNNMKRADLVIAESQYELDLLKNNFNIIGELFYKGFAFPRFEMTDKLNQVLWVGRSVELKRPEKLISLAQRMPDTHFVMVCPKADETCFAQTEEAARSCSNLDFFESLPRNELLKIFSETSVVVNTSTTEAVVNTLVEAVEYSASFVSLHIDAGGLLGKRGDDLCIGLSAYDDFDLFCQYVELMLTDKALAHEYSQRGKEYARAHWSIAEYAKKHDEAIKRLVMRNE